MAGRALLLLVGLMLALLGSAGLALPQQGMRCGGFEHRLLEKKRSQLGPVLGVDQRTVDRLLEIEQRYKPIRHRLIHEMKADLRRLQQIMKQPSPPEPEVRAILAGMRQKRKEMLNLQQRQDEEERACLTPVQQARYLMYIMSLVREARSIRGGPGKVPFTPGGPGTAPATGPVAPVGR